MLVRRHGNWRHGHYAKQGRVDRLCMRAPIAALNGRLVRPWPWPSKPIAPSWAAWREARHADLVLQLAAE